MYVDITKNIRDMFVRLSHVRSLPEAEQLIETFPRWSGDWTISGNVDGSYRVTCTYTDKNGLSDHITEAYDWADIVLEWNDISFGADNTILVDNAIFDDFKEGMHIRILFSDRDKTIYEYEMRSELDTGIVMALVASYPALSHFADQAYEEAEKWCEELDVPIDKESVSENSRDIIDIHIRVNTAAGTCRIQEKGAGPETYKISYDSDQALINQISFTLNLYLNCEEDEETVPTVSDDECARFENLKSALFDAGTDAIGDFLGIDLSAPGYDGMGKDAIDNLMDQIYEQMPQEELEKFFARYLKFEKRGMQK